MRSGYVYGNEACPKLNFVAVTRVLLVACLIGGISGSWTAFCWAGGVLLLIAVYRADIRPWSSRRSTLQVSPPRPSRGARLGSVVGQGAAPSCRRVSATLCGRRGRQSVWRREEQKANGKHGVAAEDC